MLGFGALAAKNRNISPRNVLEETSLKPDARILPFFSEFTTAASKRYMRQNPAWSGQYKPSLVFFVRRLRVVFSVGASMSPPAYQRRQF